MNEHENKFTQVINYLIYYQIVLKKIFFKNEVIVTKSKHLLLLYSIQLF